MRTWAANLAIRLAERSVFEPYKHGAVIILGGTILATATNSPKPIIPGTSCSIHAECAAIKRASRGVRGAELYVARASNGVVALSKPCKKCRAALKEAGIKRCYYSTSDGWLELDADE